MLQTERLVRVGFRIASHFAPMHTGRAALRLFCSPRRSKSLSAGEKRLAAHMRPIMDAAEQSMVAHQGGRVRTYRWRPDEGQLRGRVMLIHGWTGRALVMSGFVQPLLDRGFEVVAFDLPAHGKSSGRKLDLPLGALAMQAVVDAYGPLSGVITHSFGGPVALLAMEGGAPLERKLHVPRIVMIAAPNWLDRVTTMFGHRIGLSERAQSALESEILRQVRRPVEDFRSDLFLARTGASALIIHDEDDTDVAFASAEAIVVHNPRAKLLATKGLGHRRTIVARQVVTASAEFLASTIEPQ
jgi:esterase/lipase